MFYNKFRAGFNRLFSCIRRLKSLNSILLMKAITEEVTRSKLNERAMAQRGQMCIREKRRHIDDHLEQFNSYAYEKDRNLFFSLADTYHVASV